jgi:hypothetical protein
MSSRLWRTRRKLQVYRHNPWRDFRVWTDLTLFRRPITDLFPYERRVFSQHGEDGIIDALMTAVGAVDRFFVEFGAGDGIECNSAYLVRAKGWRGLRMDGRGCTPPDGVPIHEEFITAENINELFAKYGVPSEFDLLSIDIDGNDYWVWKAIEGYRPKVVVVEYNANVTPEEVLSIPYDPKFGWDGQSAYYGARPGRARAPGTGKGLHPGGLRELGDERLFRRERPRGGPVQSPDSDSDISGGRPRRVPQRLSAPSRQTPPAGLIPSRARSRNVGRRRLPGGHTGLFKSVVPNSAVWVNSGVIWPAGAVPDAALCLSLPRYAAPRR